MVDEHHLVPKTFGGKETFTLHRICHRKIHATFTERELLNYYNTFERLRDHTEIQKFVAWVKKKLRINDEKEQKKVAFMVSRSIMRNGTKAKPFLTPAFNESMKGFNSRVINAINKALK